LSDIINFQTLRKTNKYLKNVISKYSFLIILRKMLFCTLNNNIEKINLIHILKKKHYKTYFYSYAIKLNQSNID